MKNRFFHQYCYGFGRGLAVLAIGVVGVSALLPAVGAHAQDNNVTAPTWVLVADAALPASGGAVTDSGMPADGMAPFGNGAAVTSGGSAGTGSADTSSSAGNAGSAAPSPGVSQSADAIAAADAATVFTPKNCYGTNSMNGNCGQGGRS